MNVKWKKIASNLFLLTSGSCIFALGINSILIPKQFLTGGVGGAALIIHYLLPRYNFGLIYFILNIPLAYLGWRYISRRFMYYTFYGIAIFSLAAFVLRIPAFPIENPILAAIMAGIICGAGAGIIFRSLGSAGGLDILTVYLYKKFGLRLGSTTFFCNTLVLIIGLSVISLELVLYSLIYIYIQGVVTENVITGFSQSKSILVISEKSKDIADLILDRLDRGVTFLHGEGGYTGLQKLVIFSIIRRFEVERIKDLVLSVDPDAFMVIIDTSEVIGKRHGLRKVY